MLKSLRKNTKVIIWSVVLSFVLWGGFSVGVQFQKKARFAGEIFGRGVTHQEFERFYRSAQIFSMGTSVPQDPSVLRQKAWQSLIFYREARSQGIKVSDDEARQEILRLLSAQKMENPSPEEYRRWLQINIRETPEQFETQVRDLLQIQKLAEKIQSEIKVSPSEDTAFERYQLEQRQISIELIKFSSKDEAVKFLEETPDSAAWKKRKAREAAQFSTMISVDTQTLINQWQMSSPDIDQLFKLQSDQLSQPIQMGEDFGIFRVTGTSIPGRETFEKDFKTAYIERLTAEERAQKFMEWNIDLLTRANLQDYLEEQQLS